LLLTGQIPGVSLGFMGAQQMACNLDAVPRWPRILLKKVLILAHKWLSCIVSAKLDINAKLQCCISKTVVSFGGL